MKTMTPSYVQHHTAIIRDLYRTAKSRMGSCPLRSKETWIVPVSLCNPSMLITRALADIRFLARLSETALRVGQMPSLDLTWLIQIYPKQHKNPQIDINCRDPSLSQTHVRIQLRCCLPQWARKGQTKYYQNKPMTDRCQCWTRTWNCGICECLLALICAFAMAATSCPQDMSQHIESDWKG